MCGNKLRLKIQNVFSRRGQGNRKFISVIIFIFLTIHTSQAALAPIVLQDTLFTDSSMLDNDGDGLRDDEEYDLADYFKPLLVFDSDEASTNWEFEPRTLYQVRPAGCIGYGCPQPSYKVYIHYGFLWQRDGGYGPSSDCPNAHVGDTGGAEFHLSSSDGREWTLDSISNAAFTWPTQCINLLGNQICYPSDAAWDENHVIIYLSAHKHHQYFSTSFDHEDSKYSDYGCNDDVNGAGNRILPDLTMPLLDINHRYNNVGEPGFHNPNYFVNSLDAYGYPGEDVWTTKPFTGGLYDDCLDDPKLLLWDGFDPEENPCDTGSLVSMWMRHEFNKILIPPQWQIITYGSDGSVLGWRYVTPDPNVADPDGDGLTALQEYQGWRVEYITSAGTVAYDVKSDPNSADYDSDGKNDAQEKAAGTDPNRRDTDDDGAYDTHDGFEIDNGMNPLNFDTDGDGASDGLEIDGWLAVGSSVSDAIQATKDQNSIPPPIANPGGPYAGNEGEQIAFDASASKHSRPDRSIVSFNWDFGDGSTSTEIKPSHAYADNGAYTATLTVTDNNVPAKTDTKTVTVTVNNVVPTVDVGPDATIDEGSSFSSSGSFTDPGADTWTATVDYGDGSGIQPLTLTGKTFALSHTYAENCACTVTVTVTDDDGGVGTDTAIVTVKNVAPTVTIKDSYFVTVPVTLIIAGQGKVGNSIAFEVIQDGNVIATNKIIRAPGSPDKQEVTISATIDLSKPYSGRLKFDTEQAYSGGTPVWVIVNGVKTNVTTFNTQKSNPSSYHQTYDFALSGLVSVIGKEISFTGSATDPGADYMKFDWLFGDGGSASKLYPWPNSHSVTETVKYTYSAPGSYTVNLKVTDDDGGVGTASLAIVIS